MDLTNLTDDQLLQLIQATIIETSSRAIAIQYASKKFWQDAKKDLQAEADRQEKSAKQKEAELNNSIKATIAELLINLSFWQQHRNTLFAIHKVAKAKEIQIIIKYSKNKAITYYETGNRWALPHSINAPDFSPDILIDIKKFCKLVCDRYCTGTISSTDKDKYTVDPQLLREYTKICQN
jgi:hypothetical protein